MKIINVKGIIGKKARKDLKEETTVTKEMLG